MKWIDLPPLWLGLHVAVVWGLAPHLPFGLSAPWMATAGAVLIVFGVALMVAAVGTMWWARTTPIPHREASQLLDSGLFSRSRNPIYLGDALVLTGVVLRANSPLLLVLVPLFLWVIQRRFVEPEEARLRRQFGADFDAYCSRTRPWI